MRVQIDSWFAVATWKWDIQDPHCVICMNPFEMPCPQCKYAGEDCAPIQGQCGHHFHMHCIYKWLDTHEDCPLDRVKWQEKISNVENVSPIEQHQQQQLLQQQQQQQQQVQQLSEQSRVLGMSQNPAIQRQFVNFPQFIQDQPQFMQFAVNSNQIGGGGQGVPNSFNGQQQQ